MPVKVFVYIAMRIILAFEGLIFELEMKIRKGAVFNGTLTSSRVFVRIFSK